MSCCLLHVIEQPDDDVYRDPDVKDVVGKSPRCFCAACSPPRPLSLAEVATCVVTDNPCAKANGLAHGT